MSPTKSAKKKSAKKSTKKPTKKAAKKVAKKKATKKAAQKRSTGGKTASRSKPEQADLFSQSSKGKATKASPPRSKKKIKKSRETSGEDASSANKAEQLAAKQKDISVSEFFAKNRHLLGFDSPARALLTTVREAVDNSLDACEEAEYLPTIVVEVTLPPKNNTPFLSGIMGQASFPHSCPRFLVDCFMDRSSMPASRPGVNRESGSVLQACMET